MFRELCRAFFFYDQKALNGKNFKISKRTDEHITPKFEGSKEPEDGG